MSWKKTLASVAPTIATALGGPMAGAATKFIAEKTLGKPDATEKEIKDFILNADSDTLLKIKELDQAFELKMKELEVDLHKLAQADRASARQLASIDMRPQVCLSIAYTVGYLMLIGGLLAGWFTIPDGNAGHLVSGLIGVMTGMQAKIGDFWFGSSHGSKLKSTPKPKEDDENEFSKT